MVTVVGLWEVGYNVPLIEHHQWAFPLRDYRVDQWIMTPITGIASDHVRELPDTQAALEELASDHTIVFVDENGVTDLADFQHPENAAYVLGRAGISPYRAYGGTTPHESVRITTPAGLALLWPHQAIVLVLHDREVKRGSRSH
jgi:hypothetical protein